MNATDLPRRLLKRAVPITFRHAAWDAPSIRTTEYFRCPAESNPAWPGHDLSGGTVRCVPAPHYDAIVAEARRVGWPKAFARDVFVHDRNALSRVPSDVPLLWMLRENGSCLYAATREKIDGHNFAWEAPIFVSRTFGEDAVRFYTWDGARLREHRTKETASEATRELAQAYEKGSRPCFLPPVTVWDYRKGRDVARDCG